MVIRYVAALNSIKPNTAGPSTLFQETRESTILNAGEKKPMFLPESVGETIIELLGNRHRHWEKVTVLTTKVMTLKDSVHILM